MPLIRLFLFKIFLVKHAKQFQNTPLADYTVSDLFGQIFTPPLTPLLPSAEQEFSQLRQHIQFRIADSQQIKAPNSTILFFHFPFCGPLPAIEKIESYNGANRVQIKRPERDQNNQKCLYRNPDFSSLNTSPSPPLTHFSVTRIPEDFPNSKIETTFSRDQILHKIETLTAKSRDPKFCVQ